ncbi:Protein rds1 [Pseudocercospora fuligena]|uniref:Protein rds1 n=1 Tax=Pseudocercospora fuligena TaxID=685502 RepID=A0A8H6RQK9_9PEZI|nr:Protein rds1 [Pseudocercospora fuligena]
MRSAATLVFAALAAAAPAPVDIEKRQAINDGVILNYALTLEHLENNFYKQGLQKISAEEFYKATGDKMFYNNLKEISKDEATHVSFLTTALQGAGVTPVQPCTYNFGFKDATTFLAIANVLEGVGVSAYLGAAQFIMNKDYLTAAGSILTVESRHSAYLRENQSPAQSPFPAPFDIPLDFNQVYSLAAQFIKSCPSSNPPLPVMAFPAITVSPAGVAKPGDKLHFTVAKSVDAKAAYFITSMGPVSAQLSGSGTKYTVVVPSGAQPGQEYVILTKDSNKPTDDNTVAGPAVVQVADNAYGQNGGKGYGNGGWGGKDDKKPKGY